MEINKNNKNVNLSKKKINFFYLFNKDKTNVIKNWLFTIIVTFLDYLITNNIEKLILKNKKINDSEDLSKWFPTTIRYLLPKKINKKIFIYLNFFIIIIYLIISYFDNLLEEKIQTNSISYIKNSLLEKFSKLKFEEKKIKESEIKTLVEIESSVVGWYWNHIYNHIFHNNFSIFLIIFGKKNLMIDMWLNEKKTILISVLWIILINLINFFLLNNVLKNEKKYKEKMSEENYLINKIIDKTILIESMGLDKHYKKERQLKIEQNKNFLFSTMLTKILNKSIPNAMIQFYPFILMKLGNNTKNLFSFWQIFEGTKEVFQCLWDYGDYSSSLERINSFLSLEEKEYDLNKRIVINEQIVKKIEFKNITFSYLKKNGEKENILENYNNVFSNEKKEINYLLGENGMGKSTILYLILGMLKPISGKIIITTKDEKNEENIFDLNELNFEKWRRNNIIYLSHENLVEEGSTGQKQFENIMKGLKKNISASIFLIDEASNALDKNNREKIDNELKKLAKKGKLIINVKH